MPVSALQSHTTEQAKGAPQSAATAKTHAKAHVKAQAKAQTRAPVQSASSIVDKLAFTNGVAEVKALLREAGKNVTKSSYWSEEAKEKYRWGSEQPFQKTRALEASTGGRKRQRCVGSEGGFGTRGVLLQMLKDMRVV